MRRRLPVVAVSLTALAIVGCDGCKKRKYVSGQSSSADAPSESASAVPPIDKPPEPDPVHGLWSQRPFLARSALIKIHPRWLTVTLIDREAKCDSSRLTENDMGVQFTVPTGPDNDFFADRDMPLELRLHGAGGVSRIPAGHVTARLAKFDPEHAQKVAGSLSFRFRTAADPDAPAYESHGPFVATICNNHATEPSMAKLPVDEMPISGTVAKRNVKLRTMLAYLRDDGHGQQIVMLKGYEREVPCHTTRSATPYLFGAEVGPGTDGKYFVGAPVPTEWIMQMRTDEFSERSVHAAHGSSWLQLESVDARQGGTIRGRLAADNPDENRAYRFSLSGRFEAKVCGKETKAW